MEYGYAIRYQGTYGRIFTIGEGGFESYAEAADAMSERWQEIEDDWNGCEPVDYEIFEN